MTRTPPPPTATLGYALFATRWLQAPLYFGLVVVQGVYVYKFFNELWTLIVRCVSGRADETYVMLAVLKLVDVVMIANLLIMVIVGGYETFVSRIDLQGHRDQPEWLSHVNPNVLKVKLATAIVGISSVHLLQMFVDVHHTERHDLLWGTVIHMAFILSAAILAYMSGPMAARSEHAHAPREHAPAGRHPHHDGGPGPAGGAAPGVRPATAPLPLPAQAGPPARESHAEDRIRDAAFPARKQLEDFDTGYPRVFDRDAVARLGKLDFLAARRNVLFTGAPGTGKTHLAIALGLRACQAGHRVLFATAAEWVDRLAGAEAAGRLAEKLAGLDDVPLLIVDEVGYVPFDADAARLLFRLVAHRYERGSLIVTSDRPLERWHEVLDGPSLPAMVDRLAHHAETVRLEGDSYRRRPVTSAWAERSC
ncbi:IS21-like element helper ATPase IstB [Streptomyces glaucescens]|nr:IS21-like element helper ATPase IstB [Streptomyces glaucescens]